MLSQKRKKFQVVAWPFNHRLQVKWHLRVPIHAYQKPLLIPSLLSPPPSLWKKDYRVRSHELSIANRCIPSRFRKFIILYAWDKKISSPNPFLKAPTSKRVPSRTSEIKRAPQGLNRALLLRQIYYPLSWHWQSVSPFLPTIEFTEWYVMSSE